jgi:methionyl-tRNA formyltransferase
VSKYVALSSLQVAALVLKKLVHVSREAESSFSIVGVVTQPGRPKGRRNKGIPQPSPVEVFAREESLENILCPVKASEEDFLDTIKELNPDLCITAAYGNYLPSSFLKIPRFGTLNIHPSLLPAYRGAAPVQRAIEDGLNVSGVTVLYTVKKMDAGPILAQQEYQLDKDMQAPELLNILFNLGTELLIEKLPDVWSGLDKEYVIAQSDAAATHAAKLEKEEGRLNFHEPASVCHNKVRAFAGWPGTYHEFEIYKDGNDVPDIAQIKILRTRLSSDKNPGLGASENGKVVCSKDAMQIICGDGHVLEVLELQSPGKKATNAQAFKNGLIGKSIKWKR